MLTAQAAFIRAITQTLRTDAEITANCRGVWYGKAYHKTDLPYVFWMLTTGLRERTFGTLAYQLMPFWIKAGWADAGAENFMQGERVMQRTDYLFDGVKREDAQRIVEALNAQLVPDGWQCTSCVKQTDLPPHEEEIGQALTLVRNSMGAVFHAYLSPAP